MVRTFSDEDAPYYTALGRFITSYANAEAVVHFLARVVSGMGEDKARVVFANMRLGDLADRIRALVPLGHRKHLLPEINKCLAQMDVLAKQRGKLVHRMVSFDESALTVTNGFTAKQTHIVEHDRFSITDLEAMLGDCGMVFIRLCWVIGNETMPEPIAPWRYTPPKPNPRKTPPPEGSR